MTFPVEMLFLLFLYVAQVVIKPTEALRPDPPVVRHPISHVLEGCGSDPAGPPLRLAAACNQTGVFQHLKVAGNGGDTHGKKRCQLGDRRLARREPRPEGAARGGGERGGGGAEGGRPGTG